MIIITAKKGKNGGWGANLDLFKKGKKGGWGANSDASKKQEKEKQQKKEALIIC